MSDMAYPDYSRAERLADGVVHVVGICLALVGVLTLFWFWAVRLDGPMMASIIIYSFALIAMLTASAAYHICAHTWARPVLRRLDHAAIYVKIAGTFTPFSVMLGSAFAYLILAVVWALALVGAGMKLMSERGKMTSEWAPQMALAWVGVALVVPLAQTVPAQSLWLMAAGGAIYTSGVVFYCWDSLRFANAIWHVFILVASACFFLGISTAVAGAV